MGHGTTIQGNRSPSIQMCQWSRGVLRSLKESETIHFIEDLPNTELLFRIIHSVNKLSISGAVSNWSEQFDRRPNENELTSERSAGKEDPVDEEVLKSANSQEVNSMVCDPKNSPASANRLRENLEIFELRSRPANLRKFASLHRSRTRQKLTCATRPLTWTMASEVSVHHAESIRIHVQTQSLCSNSRRKSNLTSRRCSCRTTSWQPWTWNCISGNTRTNILGDDMPRKQSIWG